MPSPIERTTWLREKRRLAEEQMDALFASTYDEHWVETLTPTHQYFVHLMVSLCPLHGSILDAACGTGKYWPIILNVGISLLGIDQSQGMLACARSKFPQVPMKKIGLQDIRYQNAFNGVMCVDAMEHVCPEDWPLVLYNFHRALKARGYLYLTVQLADDDEIERAYDVGKAMGLPIVPGEWAHEGEYRYHPKLEEVRDWLQSMQFAIQKEDSGDEYYHFFVQKI
ncbi:MAG: class I SAM-dependent methyltransferase [Chloroflexota bacterium]